MENNYCRCKTATGCYGTVIAILAVLLSFVIGLIIGTVYASTFIEALPAIIAIAMLVVFIILRLCNTTFCRH